MPPVPGANRDPFHLCWHPGERALWLLALAEPAVWRIAEDGTGTEILSGAQLGLPEGFSPRYVHAHGFYFDTARRQPVWWASTYDEQASPGGHLLIAAFDGKTFAQIEQRGAVRTGGDDSFVFDPVRGVLVHLVARRVDRDEAEQQRRASLGGLGVRELGVDGAWRDVGAPLAEAGRGPTYAGWDAHRQQVILIDDSERTLGWDGHAWHEHGKFPTWPWHPYTCAVAPGSHRLLYLHAQRSSDDYTARCWELTDGGWAQRDPGVLEVFGGAAHDPERDRTYVYGPWSGPGTFQHTLGRFEGGALVPAGRAVAVLEGGRVGGPARFWGRRRPGHANYRIMDLYDARVVVSAIDGALRPEPSAPAGVAVLGDATGCLAITHAGEVHRLEPHGWSMRAGGPPDFALRVAVNAGIDGRGRVLMFGGESRTGRRLAESWLFDGERWSRLATKGAHPATIHAAVAYDAGRDAWIAVGGQLRNLRTDQATHELSAGKWRSFPSRFGESGSMEDHVEPLSLLVRDEATGLIVGVVLGHQEPSSLYVYRGEGGWERVAQLELPEAVGALAYDSERRTIVAAGPGALAEVEVGELLDAARGEQGPAPAKPAPDLAKPAKPARPARAGKAANPAAAAPAEAEIPASVWLRLVADGSDKFWFASHTGAGWSARWGRRGRTPSEKTYALGSRAAARAAYEQAVRAKLRAGYEHAAEREQVAVIPGRMSYRIALGRTGDDAFGGIPAGVTAETWPVCADCKHPMPHVASLHAHPERLPLTRHAAVVLFACAGERSGGACETWDPSAGCNAALLLTARELSRRALAARPPASTARRRRR
ncbi:MAG: WGR domain-containing protein [Kofleriaceae bacterium]